MTIQLTQAEAADLLAMEKHAGEEVYQFPITGGSVRIPVYSEDRHEEFFLDVTRSTIRLTKATLQHRARKAVVLVRIDLDGPPHRNPDDTEVACPHIHYYREGYGDKWAEPLPSWVTKPDNHMQTLLDLMGFCNVISLPKFENELFQ